MPHPLVALEAFLPPGCRGYGQRHRLEWLGKIQEPGVRRRAEFYYLQLDALRSLRLVVRRELLLESGEHSASKLLSQIPSIGRLAPSGRPC
jgi:hypothetical protein